MLPNLHIEILEISKLEELSLRHHPDLAALRGES
jgi:hypothetical protein